MKVIKFAPGLIPVLKHGTHDQKTHGSWAHGSAVGDFTLEAGADSKKLATYSHPNGTKVIFQNLSKVESSSPMVKETLETISDLSAKYPVANLTFVVQSGEGGGVVTRGYDGVCFSQSGDKTYSERVEAWLKYKNMPPATDTSAPYIVIRQRVLAPDSMPRTSPLPYGGTLIRSEKTPAQKTAYLKELITHEWGHALDTRTNAVSAAQFRNRDVASTSAYGQKNGREFFAETFAAFELGGLVKDRPNNIPNYKKASEYLQMSSLKGKVSKESFEGFICYENFETGEPLLIEDGLPLGFDLVLKHGTHDQKDHGNWATGSQGSVSELSDDEIRDVIYNSKTVNEMLHKVADRLGKSMKPSVANLSENEITHYRGVWDKTRDAQRLLDGKVKFTEFQTWGQGIYMAEEKDIASNYGTLISMRLDPSARMVRGETTWDSAFEVNYENPNARTRNTTTSNFIDLSRIENTIRAGKMDNLSISDMRNIYWAAKGYDGFTTYGETVLFNGSKLTVNRADIGEAVKKHQEHDQKTHGSWANGGGSSESGLDSMPYGWNPKIKTPSDTSTEFEDFEYKQGKQYLEEAAISPTAIRLSGGELNYITILGRFKTLEEQPDLKDNDDYRQARQELEVGLWGIPEKDVGPIYGYIDTPLQPSLDNETRNYGDIKVILKDSVAGRTTMTAGDSANSGLTPVLLKDVREGNLTNQQVDGAYRSRAFQTDATTVYSPRIIVTGHTRLGYYEAQIHGGVSLKDIKSVDIRFQSGYSPPVSKNTIQTLKEMGIEVIQND